jgi:copper chaperone CopZ
VCGALAKIPGVGEVAMKAGDHDFTVHFDSKQVKVDAILAAIHGTGHKDAKVKP